MPNWGRGCYIWHIRRFRRLQQRSNVRRQPSTAGDHLQREIYHDERRKYGILYKELPGFVNLPVSCTAHDTSYRVTLYENFRIKNCAKNCTGLRKEVYDFGRKGPDATLHTIPSARYVVTRGTETEGWVRTLALLGTGPLGLKLGDMAENKRIAACR